MIKNIPNKYSQKMVIKELNVQFNDKFDFFYLPIDFVNKCNMGYAFINLKDFRDVDNFYKEFNNKKWPKFNSKKVCKI